MYVYICILFIYLINSTISIKLLGLMRYVGILPAYK